MVRVVLRVLREVLGRWGLRRGCFNALACGGFPVLGEIDLGAFEESAVAHLGGAGADSQCFFETFARSVVVPKLSECSPAQCEQ